MGKETWELPHKMRYNIRIIVEVDNRQYIENRQYPDSGCNHVQNIPGTADYMGQEILKKILEDNKC